MWLAPGTTLLVLGLTAACSSDSADTPPLTDEQYLAAFDNSPWENAEEDALLQAGRDLCNESDEADDLFMMAMAFEGQGFTTEKAIQASSAVMARFCPELFPSE